MTTRQLITDRYGVPLSLDDTDAADIDVPILTGPQRQGDVAWFPRPPMTPAERSQAVPVPPEGVALVVGEATGNSHTLQSEPAGAILWAPRSPQPGGTLLGICEIPDGAVGWVSHSDEHGHHGIAPDCYEVRGKRTQREEIERVQD
jgi:hypothetical protein